MSGCRRARRARGSIEVLGQVGFPDPEAAFGRYPFELSGGLRQRAMLASALVCRPALVIADEPTSALDVTVQALALKLLADLQDEMGLSLLFITHDFGVVANVADYVVVLRDGAVVEQGSMREVLTAPRSDYARALLAAVPRLEGEPFVLNPPHAAQQRDPNAGAGVERAHGAARRVRRLIEIKDVSKSFTPRKRGMDARGRHRRCGAGRRSDDQRGRVRRACRRERVREVDVVENDLARADAGFAEAIRAL